jgi:hypothetical protein
MYRPRRMGPAPPSPAGRSALAAASFRPGPPGSDRARTAPSHAQALEGDVERCAKIASDQFCCQIRLWITFVPPRIGFVLPTGASRRPPSIRDASSVPIVSSRWPWHYSRWLLSRRQSVDLTRWGILRSTLQRLGRAHVPADHRWSTQAASSDAGCVLCTVDSHRLRFRYARRYWRPFETPNGRKICWRLCMIRER